MKNKIWIYLLVAFLGIAASIAPKIFKVRAQDPIDVYVKVEASTDNGATWHNFESTKNAGGETLTIEGGDIVLLKVKMWNESEDVGTLGTIGVGSLSNSGYISNAEVVSLNEDGNGVSYDGYFWGTGATGTINLDPAGSETTGYESLTARITIAQNIPANTIIEGRVTVQDEGDEQIIGFNFFEVANVFADGMGRYSTCRLATAVLPQTGADLGTVIE